MAVRNDSRKNGFIDRLKKKMVAYLDRLAAENKKTFGNGPLDCCQLNRPKNQK